MALNPFFLQGSTTEQFLIQDLINEHLKIFGIDVYYLPRKFFKTDDIIREVQSSKFDDNFIIEAYLNNYEGYSPGADLMTKFGISLRNEVILTISRERFEEFITPFLQGISSGIDDGLITDYDLGNLTTRPKEGDLIYFPLGERLFEIKHVEFEKPFYQLGKNYIYELNCELYEYENELIDTSIDEIDDTVSDEGYITTLTLVGTAVTATATAFVGGSGMVGQIVINNDGSGYTTSPSVSISSPISGTTATAVAITTTKGGVSSIESILITNPGSGYTNTNPPTVTIFGGNGVGAAATAIIVDSGITTFTINGGSGYYTKPIVTISGPSVGVTAIVDPVISNGQVTSLRFANTGYGYTQAPTVSIAGTSSIGIGTFVYNELVEGQTSGTKARVKDFRTIPASTGVSTITYLRVSINSGEFYPGEIVVGGISSARYLVSSYTTDSYDDSYDQNQELQEEANSIIDFSESNPFGEY
jgi:hypothetical protein